MGTLMRFAAESWSALSCRESSVRLIYQSLGSTADGTGEEAANGKLGMYQQVLTRTTLARRPLCFHEAIDVITAICRCVITAWRATNYLLSLLHYLRGVVQNWCPLLYYSAIIPSNYIFLL